MSDHTDSNQSLDGHVTSRQDHVMTSQYQRDENSSSMPSTPQGQGQALVISTPGSPSGSQSFPDSPAGHRSTPVTPLLAYYRGGDPVSSPPHLPLSYSILSGLAGHVLGRPVRPQVGSPTEIGIAGGGLGGGLGHQGPQPISPPPPAPQISAAELTLLTEASATKNGTFQCTLCNKQFGYKNGLIRHVRLTHVGEKPYQCTICNRRFGYKHILMEHQNLHFGNRPYACPQCDKRFAARSNLIQHRMVHKRPYNCTLCAKRFDREDQLKKHLFAHPQALLMCGVCRFIAASQSELSQHIMEEHGGDVFHSRRYDEEDLGRDRRSSETGEEGMESAMQQDSSEEHSVSGSSRSVGADGRGHRIDAICSQLSSSVASGYFHQLAQGPPHNVIIKKELVDAEQDEESRTEPVSPRGQHLASTASNSSAAAAAAYNQFMEQFPWPPIFSAAAAVSGANSLFPANISRPTSSGLSPASYSAVDFLAAAAAVGKSLSTPLITAPASDDKLPPSTLPGIHEVFSRRNQKLPSFANFIPALQMKGAAAGPAAAPLPEILLHSLPPPPPLSQTSLTAVVSSIGSSGTGSVTAGGPTTSQRPTAQLPPITHAMRQNRASQNAGTQGGSSEVGIINSGGDEGSGMGGAVQQSPATAFQSLDDVLSHYIGQGRLFKCVHCNILFFERGMYFLHASLHGLQSPWECSICHKVCADKNEFTLHFVNQQHNS